MARPAKGKMPLEAALITIFSKGGTPDGADIEARLKRMLGWSPSRHNLYLYGTKFNGGRLFLQHGIVPNQKLGLKKIDPKPTPKKRK